MTENEIIEGNKLIAEFMGFYVTEFNGYCHFVCKEKKKPEHLNQAWEFRLEESEYHSSWDWLMPVVEKIENNCKAHVCMFDKRCWIEFYGVHNDPTKFHYKEYTYIENVWRCVVEFIKWYNQQITFNNNGKIYQSNRP